MTTRRTGLITALLLTAALFLCIPSLLRPLTRGDTNRMDERLRPARLHTLTVWLVRGEMEDRRVVTRACTAFEKQTPGVRVFLRVVSADELTAPEAVLPDVVLFETGDIVLPEAVLLPLAQSVEPSGQFRGVAYALPLWMDVNVLSIPQSWFGGAEHGEARGASLLAASTPAPERDERAMIDTDELPWPLLLRPDALERPRGVAQQQLLMCCPQGLRAELIAACTGRAAKAQPTPAPSGWETTLPIARGATATPAPKALPPARVQTLAAFQQRLRDGEALRVCVLPPAVTQRVRYAALCRDSEQARAFARYLREEAETLDLGLLPARGGDAEDALLSAALKLYATKTLPNAFAHTREELLSLCADAFERGEDPVATLLSLR